MRKRCHPNQAAREGINPLIRLWMLRILLLLKGVNNFVKPNGYQNDEVAQCLGLREFPSFKEDVGAAKAAAKELRKLHEQAEDSQPDISSFPALKANVEHLARLVDLSETDCLLLQFSICLHNERLLDEVAEMLGDLTSVKMIAALAVILNVSKTQLQQALDANGLLARSGLVVLDRNGRYTLHGKLNLLSSSFADQMAMSEADPVGLLRGVVTPAAKAKLTLADYSHVHADLSILLPFLRHAVEVGRKGVNILVHGVPGTGKSELARTLAAELGCELFDVASEDNDGDPINGVRRLRSLSAGQCFFAQRRSLITFDEMEDVFNDGDWFSRSTAQTHKAWINRMLEDNPLPVFWLSNQINGMDPAFVRRFDMVFELPVPPRKQREKVVRQYGGELLDEVHIARLSEVETLAPAVVERAAGVIYAIKDDLGREQSIEAFTHLVSGTLEAQGHRPLKRHDANRLPEIYDPAFVHADTDLQALLGGIRAAGAARLCLYGPPGTGKTAYGRWLAQQLEKPFITKRASDLMSMWVGENEQNIASAFKQAERENALLLIDEVDSFLRDRRSAKAGWEASMVNEMLTQMEAFSGVFIASTNLVDNLDQAALRRFDLKAKFDFLRADQACTLFQRYCDVMTLPQPGKAELEEVASMRLLTPGDFATVMRQHRFRPVQTAAALLDALAAECAMKEGTGSRAIGFVQ